MKKRNENQHKYIQETKNGKYILYVFILFSHYLFSDKANNCHCQFDETVTTRFFSKETLCSFPFFSSLAFFFLRFFFLPSHFFL